MLETWEMQVQSLALEDPLEKEMATHCSILAGKIPKRSRMNFSTENYYFREYKEKQHILIKIWRDQSRRRLKIYHQL